MMPLTKPKSTRDAIIQILSREWPKTAKELYNAVVKELGTNLSYQAVYKTIGELVSENIVSKNGNNFSLNKSWISQMKNFSETLEKSYASDKPLMKSHETETFYYKTLYEFYGNFLDIIVANFNDENKNSVAVGHYIDLPWALALGDILYKNLVKIANHCNCYAICRNNNDGNKIIRKMFEKVGIKTRIGISQVGIAYDVSALCGITYHHFIPQETRKKLNKIYTNVRTIDDIIESDIIEEVFNKKAKVKLVVSKNPELAQELINFTLGFFKEGGK